MAYFFHRMFSHPILSFFFFFNDTATTEIYTLSLHDALPISCSVRADDGGPGLWRPLSSSEASCTIVGTISDRKSTRLNSSHLVISYAVFCLKKKKYIRTSKHVVHTIPSLTLTLCSACASCFC